MNLNGQSATLGDALAVVALAQRVISNADDCHAIHEAEHSFIARLIGPLWRTLNETQQDEVRTAVAIRDSEFAYVGLDRLIAESGTRSWLAIQSHSLSVGGMLDLLAAGEPPAPQPEVSR